MPTQQTLPAFGGGFYQQSVNQGIADYGDVMAGYQQALGAQQGAQAGIQSGYQNLAGSLQQILGFGGSPWGVAAPAAQAIADVYAKAQGATKQGLISSGLGNSTVLPAMLRGNALDASKAYAGLGAQLASTRAGYEANIGLAGLNQQAQGARDATAIRLAQAGYAGQRYNTGFAPVPGSFGGGHVGGGGGNVNWGNAGQDRGRLAGGGGYAPYRPVTYGDPSGIAGPVVTGVMNDYQQQPNQGYALDQINQLNMPSGPWQGADMSGMTPTDFYGGGYNAGGYGTGADMSGQTSEDFWGS